MVNCILLALNTPLPSQDKSELNIRLVSAYCFFACFAAYAKSYKETVFIHAECQEQLLISERRAKLVTVAFDGALNSLFTFETIKL